VCSERTHDAGIRFSCHLAKAQGALGNFLATGYGVHGLVQGPSPAKIQDAWSACHTRGTFEYIGNKYTCFLIPAPFGTNRRPTPIMGMPE
jgi:hypothetical protein